MVDIIKTIAVILGIYFLVIDLKRYIGGNRNIIVFLQCVCFFFYYIPMICDLVYSRPNYESWSWGFIKSHKDPTTEIIYCVVISYITYMFHYFQKKHTVSNLFDDLKMNSSKISFLLLFLLSIIIIYVIMQIDGESLKSILTYNMRHQRRENDTIVKNIAFAIIGLALVYICIEPKVRVLILKIIYMFPILTFACLLNGKRTSVFMCVVGLLMILIVKHVIKKKVTLILIVGISLSLLAIYVSFYNDSVTEEADAYLSYRINYGRDDTLKMTIYSELYDDGILEYRGQTLLYYLTFYIPRNVWNTKPYPYATYLTAYLCNLGEVRNLGWNMTTSIFDEFLSNFGWLGLLLVPFIINKCIKGIMKRNKGILGMSIVFLGLLDVVMLIAVQASAFLILYLLLILLIIVYDRKEKKFKKRSEGIE